MSHTPEITAIICTHNRARYLDGSIGSLTQQTLATDRFEIIVVDNTSTDGTANWCASAARNLRNFRYLIEPSLGLTHARNTGWRSARGDIVAFLDDDAVAEPDWLEVLINKFREYGSQVAAIGGKVIPLWESAPPAWLAPQFWSYLSVLDTSTKDIVLDDSKYFVGANMAFRTKSLNEVGGFNSALGRQGGKLLSNEEVHLKRLLEDAGYFTMYTPDAKVAHSVPIERMTKQWFRRRHYWQGISDVAMDRIQGPTSPRPPRLLGLLRELRPTVALAIEGLRGLPRWIVGRDAQNDFAWHYRAGRAMARWKDAFFG